MNRTELVSAIAAKAGTTKTSADAVLSATLESIMDAVATGDKVQLVGFGTFESSERAARSGRNPQTGEAMTIQATTTPKFKAGKEFKERVKA